MAENVPHGEFREGDEAPDAVIDDWRLYPGDHRARDEIALRQPPTIPEVEAIVEGFEDSPQPSLEDMLDAYSRETDG